MITEMIVSVGFRFTRTKEQQEDDFQQLFKKYLGRNIDYKLKSEISAEVDKYYSKITVVDITTVKTTASNDD